MANADNVKKHVVLERKMDETPLFLDLMVNQYNKQTQIQLNETYTPKDAPEGTFEYGRKTVNLNIIDIPEVVKAIVALYEEETGKEVTL